MTTPPMLLAHARALPALAIPALTLLAGCPDRTISKVVPEQAGIEVKDIPVRIERDLDLLFLIDKSPTMADEQAGLAANFPRFIEVLSQFEGGLPNVHIGVISQDLGAGGLTVGGNCAGAGDDGDLLATPRLPGCTPPNGNFISDVEGLAGAPRVVNYAGALADTFACIASLGPSGCGFEQHLGSLKKALIGNPANAGFLRPDAFLAIVIISDEDDCTAANPRLYDPDPALVGELGPFADFRCFEWGWECDQGTLARAPGDYTGCRPRTSSPYLAHPDAFVDDIKALKTDPSKIIVATLIGPRPQDLSPPQPTRVTLNPAMNNVPTVQPSCVNGAQNAFPMPRLHHFAQQFPGSNTAYSLCDNDLSAGLTEVAETIKLRMGDPCFQSELDQTDLDPANPGLQPQCTVAEITGAGTAAEAEAILPACAMADATTPAATTATPCWYVVPDPDKCETFPTQLKLMIDQGDRVVPSDARLRVHCVTAA